MSERVYDEADTVAKRVVELAIKEKGAQSNEFAKALTNLAIVQHHTRQYEAAQQNFETAIEIIEDNEDRLNAQLVNPLKGLGASQLESGRPDLAKQTFGRAVHVTHVNEGPHNLDLEVTRTQLERLVRPVIERCRQPVEQALHDAGISAKDIDRLVFVGGPTRMPCVRDFFEDCFARKGELGVDPMECVAQGAAIQAGVLSGDVGDIVLIDVTPLTLGVETLGGVATPIISRNTPVPVKHSEMFTTAADMQTSVTIHVYQGERPMAGDNTSLGEFNLEGLALNFFSGQLYLDVSICLPEDFRCNKQIQ